MKFFIKFLLQPQIFSAILEKEKKILNLLHMLVRVNISMLISMMNIHSRRCDGDGNGDMFLFMFYFFLNVCVCVGKANKQQRKRLIETFCNTVM